MNTQTRLKLTLGTAGFLGLVTLIALFGKLETVATAGIAAIMTILSAYIWSQTLRPTIYENENDTKRNKRAKRSRSNNTGAGNMDNSNPQ